MPTDPAVLRPTLPPQPTPTPWWWRRLLQDNCFGQLVAARWYEMRRGALATPSVLSAIDAMVQQLADAPGRNFLVWPVPLRQLQWSQSEPRCAEYACYIARLRRWTELRLRWIDENVPLLSLAEPRACNASHIVPTQALDCVSAPQLAPEPQLPIVSQATQQANAAAFFRGHSDADDAWRWTQRMRRPLCASRYDLYAPPGNVAAHPSAWQILARNSVDSASASGTGRNGSWAVLDERHGVIFAAAYQLRSFALPTGQRPAGVFDEWALRVTALRGNATAPRIVGLRYYVGADCRASYDGAAAGVSDEAVLGSARVTGIGLRAEFYADHDFGCAAGAGCEPALVLAATNTSIAYGGADGLPWPRSDALPNGAVWGSARFTGWLRAELSVQLDAAFGVYAATASNDEPAGQWDVWMGETQLYDVTYERSVRREHGGLYYVRVDWVAPLDLDLLAPAYEPSVRLRWFFDETDGMLADEVVPAALLHPSADECWGPRVIRAANGTLRIPADPDQGLYHTDQVCEFRIVLPPESADRYIGITFETFALGLGDYVAVLDGPKRFERLHAVGDTVPPPVVAGVPGGLTVVFSSNWFDVSAGFTAHFTIYDAPGMVPYNCSRWHNCSLHGNCSFDGSCVCDAGWIEPDCSAQCPLNCSLHGASWPPCVRARV